MGALLVRLLTWLGGSAVLKFAAQKALFTGLLTTVLGVVLYNFGVDWIEETINWGLSAMGGVSAPGAPQGIVTQLSGLTGYLAAHLKIPQCLSFVMSVVVARFTIKLVAGFVPGLSGLK